MTADSGYFIRTGRPEDVPGVDALLSRSYPRLLKADYAPSTLVTAIPLLARARPALVACGTYYVAHLADGTIIGAGGWTRHNPATGRADDRIASVRHFATDPDLVRRGIGRALMNRCLREARAAGLMGLLCYATRTAVPFYAAQGFLPLAEVEIELQPGVRFPAVRMERSLR